MSCLPLSRCSMKTHDLLCSAILYAFSWALFFNSNYTVVLLVFIISSLMVRSCLLEKLHFILCTSSCLWESTSHNLVMSDLKALFWSSWISFGELFFNLFIYLTSRPQALSQPPLPVFLFLLDSLPPTPLSPLLLSPSRKGHISCD